jgi:small-conductance mechanosensitive channel
MEDSTQIINFIRVGGLLPAALVLVVTWLVVRVIAGTLDRVGDRFADRRLVLQQVATVLRFGAYFLGISAAVMFAFRLSEQALLALGGTIAVAVGIALKDLAASIVAGLMILFDRPFQVGDRVSFDGNYGEITQIGLRSVKLKTLEDNLVTIPNNKFLTDVVSSGNAGALDMLVQMDFYIGVDQDLDAARDIVRDAITSSRYTYLGKPWNVLLSSVIQDRYVALQLRAKVYVLDVQYEKALVSDVTERVMMGFGEAGIQPPAILHRTVGELKGGPGSVAVA